MAKSISYRAAQSIILDALELAHWTVKRGLKVPYATDMAGHLRLYFKSQSIYADSRPFSLNAARSIHVDPRHIASLSPSDIPWRLKELGRDFTRHVNSSVARRSTTQRPKQVVLLSSVMRKALA